MTREELLEMRREIDQLLSHPEESEYTEEEVVTNYINSLRLGDEFTVKDIGKVIQEVFNRPMHSRSCQNRLLREHLRNGTIIQWRHLPPKAKKARVKFQKVKDL